MPEQSETRFLKTRLGIIYVLSGLLIFYHVSTVFEFYFGTRLVQPSVFHHLQPPIRLAIAISLLLLLFRVRGALWGMWLSITALVVTRYLLLLEGDTSTETEIAVYFSYLRGFIIPTVITLIHPRYEKPQ